VGKVKRQSVQIKSSPAISGVAQALQTRGNTKSRKAFSIIKNVKLEVKNGGILMPLTLYFFDTIP
jgi:hypothetical protein